jgi:secondary thiamine-phosphate synthase enzyme
LETYIQNNFPAGAGYAHDQIDDNAASHVASAFIGQSRTIPVNNGKLIRGTWQNIFVVELDGPRKSRSVIVTVIGQ